MFIWTISDVFELIGLGIVLAWLGLMGILYLIEKYFP